MYDLEDLLSRTWGSSDIDNPAEPPATWRKRFLHPVGLRPRNREDQHIFYPGSSAIADTSNEPRMLRALGLIQLRTLHSPQHQNSGQSWYLLGLKATRCTWSAVVQLISGESIGSLRGKHPR